MTIVAPLGETPSLAGKAYAYGASRVGREHLRVGKNNQDGFSLRAEGRRAVAVVTDGCGSQAHSEVGALLGAQFLAGHLWRAPLTSELAEGATLALGDFLSRLVSEVGGASTAEVLERHFLFTFLAAVKEGPRAMVFGVGDGAVIVDGVLRQLDPGPDNAPAYCAYRLTGQGDPRPQLHFEGDAAVVAVMTDGFDGLLRQDSERVTGLFEGASEWRNPLTLQRRLNVLSDTERVSDDATLVVLGG